MPTLTRPKVVEYRRPHLYPKQHAAIFNDARYSVIEASTKSGKTHGCIVWLHEQAAIHGGPRHNYWWVAPIHAQTKMAYDRLIDALPANTFATNRTELSVSLGNGSKIWFKSGHESDSLYGEDVYAAVVDEATRVKEDSWIALRSTLTATRGKVRIIGNVKGRKNWAYRLARRAEQGAKGLHYARLTAYDAADGGLFERDEIDDARSMMPEQAFNELYLAIPGDDGGNPFGRAAIEDCTATWEELHELAGPSKVWGWDLAKKHDFTVGIALDDHGNTVQLQRFQKQWADTITEIVRTSGLLPALVDATGVGDPIVEELQRHGNYEGFMFSRTSRQQLLEGLAVKISKRAVRFPQIVADELENFEYVYIPTGVKYAAPEGLHDDCVMALALAVSKLGHASGLPVIRWLN